MKKIRIAQIGIGHDHAANIWESLGRNKDRFDIVGWYAPAEEKARFADRLAPMPVFPSLRSKRRWGTAWTRLPSRRKKSL